MDWDKLEALCAKVEETARVQAPLINAELEIKRRATAPLRTSSTLQSRGFRDVGHRRRQGELDVRRSRGLFSDFGLTIPAVNAKMSAPSASFPCEIPRPPQRLLQRPRSAPALDPRRECLSSFESTAAAQPGWQEHDPEEKTAVGIRSTRASAIRGALAAGLSTPDIKRIFGEVAGVGFGIGNRFENPECKPGPGDYEEINGNVSVWCPSKSCPTLQPCAKYRSAAAPTMCSNPNAPRPRTDWVMPHSQGQTGRRRALKRVSCDWMEEPRLSIASWEVKQRSRRPR